VWIVLRCFCQYGADSRHSRKTSAAWLSLGFASELLFAFEMAFTVKLKVLSGLRNLKDLHELVGNMYLVGFAVSESRRNVLVDFLRENNRLTISA
jgi:hypothetical protein